MKRIAVIDRNKCIREKCGYLCRQICPPVRMGIDAIIVNEEGWPVIDENLCTGCGLCPKKCPTNAIKVINLVGEAGEPLHQYGVNMFRIYNFAVPKAGSVTALVGRNGIGKTTLLDILSGKIIPNMFDLLSEPSYQSILTRTKNKVLMSYFERLMSGQRMSYKVQNVELLRKAAPNELVGDVINRFDERKVSAEIIKNLGMGKFLDSTILSLSGGELQKTAVAIAISKEADVYFFDEPSSYLDIYERVRVAREISRLAEEFGKQVIVVEHDLALLDYLAEYVYVLYGVPGAYGVVSGIKGARTGINEFMDGYLREENVRFRETSLRFELYSAAESGKQIFFSYPSMEKNYGRFMLHADAGNVRKGEVVGIVGPNAIGKSTFIKLMAGVEKPDNDAKIPEMTISYKPQYIKIDFDGKVDEYITIEKVGQEYIKEFELDGLLHKKVAHLSGGEIQRLAIACALSKDVDIYLLDEPSAFLDIEQRMRLSTIITRDIMNKEKVCFVVDHDIVFIDSIASRIIRFAGTSSVEGHANSPEDKVAAMNAFLKDIDITLRRDKDTLRPKINKKGSVLDREQRQAGNYYYYVS